MLYKQRKLGTFVTLLGLAGSFCINSLGFNTEARAQYSELPKIKPAPISAIHFLVPAIGYHTHGIKTMIVEDVPTHLRHPHFVLYDPNKHNPHFKAIVGQNVFEKVKVIELGTKSNLPGPGTRKLLLDFSDFKDNGPVEVHLRGHDVKSSLFPVASFVYWDALKPVMRSFFFERCGQEVDAPKIRLFHGACHTEDAPLANPSSEARRVDAVGGWHNGDSYDKSVSLTAIATSELMGVDEGDGPWANRPLRKFSMDYPFSEPGLGTTDDFHHEVRHGLDWLRAMQRKQDGAMYSGVRGTEPASLQKSLRTPDEDEQPRLVDGVATRETADAVAAFAQGARDFSQADMGYSVKLLMLAEKGWEFLQAHPEPIPVGRDAKDDQNHRFWALAELYAATGKEVYHKAFLQQLSTLTSIQTPSLENPALLGLVHYALYAPKPDAAALTSIKNQLDQMAASIAEAVENDPYGAGLARFATTSNRRVVERANILLASYRLTGNKRYREAASKSVSYIFGGNPLGTSYVSGMGEHAAQHLAHPWLSRVQEEKRLAAGFMVSGPNASATDGVTPLDMGSASYMDSIRAISSNQSTLLDGSALAALLGALNSAYNAEAQASSAGSSHSSGDLPSPLNYELAPEKPNYKKGH